MWWFYLSLSSILMITLAELTQQKILNDKNALTPRASLILTWSIQGIFAFLFILGAGKIATLPSYFQLIDYRYAIATIILSLFSGYMYFKSFQVKNISFSIILLSSSIVISTTLGIILFSESIAPIKFLGIFLVIVSLILVNLNNIHIEKNHIYGLGAGILLGFMYVIDKAVVSQIDPMVYTFWICMLLGMANLIIDPIKSPKSIKLTYKDGKFIFKILVLSCLGYYLYNLLTYYAYNAGGEVGKVDAVNNSYIFAVIAYEYFVLKHKDGIVRKLGSSLLAVTGILILGFF